MSSTAVVINPKVTRDLAQKMAKRLIGQPDAIDPVVRCVQMYAAGLGPSDRPAGVFLFLGPTGSGKTRTVEALAECLHGSRKCLLRIDCGEFTHDHEVAKLIGSPPGYTGHRETHPIFSQEKLKLNTSDNSRLSIVLFDEIEKASPSVLRMLLGILDKGTIKLGTNEIVNFEDTIIFFTSNLGAREIEASMKSAYGLGSAHGNTVRVESQAMRAAKRHFTPEFYNRLDHVILYRSLTVEAMEQILLIELEKQQEHIVNRMGTQCFEIVVDAAARAWLLANGFSPLYGARELKRILQDKIMAPLALKVVNGEVDPGARVEVTTVQGDLEIQVARSSRCPFCKALSIPEGERCGSCGKTAPLVPPMAAKG